MALMIKVFAYTANESFIIAVSVDTDSGKGLGLMVLLIAVQVVYPFGSHKVFIKDFQTLLQFYRIEKSFPSIKNNLFYLKILR